MSIDRNDTTPLVVEWEAPRRIDRNDKTPLPVSVGRAPARLWAMVDAVAEAYQVPRALPFMVILSILSTSVGGRRRVQVTPDWTETLSIYTAVALPSGERKSPVMSALSAPLREHEEALVAELEPEIALQRNLRDLRASAVEKLKRKGDTSPTAIAKLESAVTELEETVVPARPRLLADDSTPEAMALLMAQQDGRLGVLSSEGGLFATLAGRYSNGVANLDLVLKAWSGDFCRVDRVSREVVTLAEPVLSIGLAVQPDILAGLAEAKHFRGSGLLARFLYALPESLVGTRNPDPDPVPEHVATDYADAVESMAKALWRSTTDDMKLTEAARDALTVFRVDLEPRLHPETGELAHIADWANKLPGQLVRIAALFTLFDNPHAVEVDATAMVDALDLAPYFMSHAREAFDVMSTRQNPLTPARAVLRWIKRNKHEQFTLREAHRALAGQAWCDSADDVREALDDLEDLGWVQPKPQPERAGKPGRRPAPYLVNPAALSVNSVNAQGGSQA